MAKVGNIASERLLSFIQRVERLREEIKATNKDVAEVYSEAKGAGFDVKILKRCIQLRAMDKSDRDEMEELVEVYMRALEEAGTVVATRVHAHEGPKQKRPVNPKVAKPVEPSSTPRAPETGEIHDTEIQSAAGPNDGADEGLEIALQGDASPPRDGSEGQDSAVQLMTEEGPRPQHARHHSGSVVNEAGLSLNNALEAELDERRNSTAQVAGSNPAQGSTPDDLCEIPEHLRRRV